MLQNLWQPYQPQATAGSDIAAISPSLPGAAAPALEPVAAQRAASARAGSSAAADIMPASIASQTEAPASAPAPAPAVSAAAVPFAEAAKQASPMSAPIALTLQAVHWLPLSMPAMSCTQLLAVRYRTINRGELSWSIKSICGRRHLYCCCCTGGWVCWGEPVTCKACRDHCWRVCCCCTSTG